MHTTLEPAALAYLLHTLGAQKVVGVANRRLFPKEEAARDALLGTGFARLKASGWLKEAEAGLHMNDRLMLMAAVLAAPQQVTTTTVLSDDSRQTVTIYLANGHAVEQYLTPAGAYALTYLGDAAAVAPRLASALAVLVAEPERPFRLTLGRAAFAAARRGQAAELPPAQARLLAALAPVARIEIAAFAETAVAAYDEVLLLSAAGGAGWLLAGTDETVTLMPFTEATLARLLATGLRKTVAAVGDAHGR